MTQWTVCLRPIRQRGVEGSTARPLVTTSSHTIQAAINAVASGGTIYVYSGTYAENLLVNKSVTMLGANNNISGDGMRGAESSRFAPTAIRRVW